MTIENTYPNEFELLDGIYKPDEIDAELAKMNATFIKTEALWQRYLEMIPGKRVKYLMIGEAPPCSDAEEVPYIFNPDAQPKKLFGAVCKAFFGSAIYKEVGVAETLKQLAKRGFLAVDPIPFAMPYSKGGKRGRKGYETLLRETAQTYFLEKLNDSGIIWDENVKIAFYLRKTAGIIIDQFSAGLPLDGIATPIKLSSEMVAINAANYPDAGVLQGIYRLGH